MNIANREKTVGEMPVKAKVGRLGKSHFSRMDFCIFQGLDVSASSIRRYLIVAQAGGHFKINWKNSARQSAMRYVQCCGANEISN